MAPAPALDPALSVCYLARSTSLLRIILGFGLGVCLGLGMGLGLGLGLGLGMT